MPRGWHTPDGAPPKGGRKPKGGRRLNLRLSTEATEALDLLRAGGDQTAAVERALVEVAEDKAIPKTLKLHRPALAAIVRLRDAWGIPSDAGVIERAVLEAASKLVEGG